MRQLTTGIASQAFLLQMKALLNRPVGCAAKSFVPPPDLQALPATYMDIIDVRAALLRQQCAVPAPDQPGCTTEDQCFIRRRHSATTAAESQASAADDFLSSVSSVENDEQ
jgi:hypothetical protein